MRIPGIKYEKDAKGNNRYLRIDLKKHGEAVKPLLEQLGAGNGDDAYDEGFEKEWRECITGDELVKRVTEHIKTLPWKK